MLATEFHTQIGNVTFERHIASIEGHFPDILEDTTRSGAATEHLGDLDGNTPGFPPDTEIPPGSGFSATLLDDLDGDGIGELLIGEPFANVDGNEHGALWLLFRKPDVVDSAAGPSIGSTWSATTDSAAGGQGTAIVFVVGYADWTQPALTTNGELFVDWSQPYRLALSGIVPASGVVGFSTLVANDTALIDQVLYLQGVLSNVYGVVRLTNGLVLVVGRPSPGIRVRRSSRAPSPALQGSAWPR